MDETTTPTTSQRSGSGSLQNLVNGRLFGLFSLMCALAAAALWYVTGGSLGPWPLLVASPPWVMRLAAGRLPVKTTRFDPLLWSFIASAAVGAWAAYNQPAAWGKFWLIIGAAVLFYALAGQRSVNLWLIITGLALFGGAIGVYFLATHDWVSFPSTFELFNQWGQRWMAIRPATLNSLHDLHPNVAAGLMAMMFPFSLAAGIRAARKRRRAFLVAAILSGILMTVGMVFATSRGAVLGLVGGLIAWLLWVGSEQIAQTFYLSRRKAFGLQFLILLGIGLGLLLIIPGGLARVLEFFPSPASAVSRLEISRNALDLIGDFWVTGGGLGAFDGLYSQYIRVIPFHVLIHSHNVFIDVAVEQGIFGLLFFIGLLMAAIWWLIDPNQSGGRRSIHDASLVNGAALSALVVIGLHGLVDDPLYGSRALLLLFLPLGLTAILFPLREGWMERIQSIDQQGLIGIGITTLLIAITLISYQRSVLSILQANLGAVEMARIELGDFPTGKWSDGREAPALAPARASFERVLELNPNNRTALHRLGLIAMLERDFETAKDYLYRAYLADQSHKGIRKSLMYSYVWVNEIPKALPFMADFPEARGDLGVYRGWWIRQGYPDLGRLAEEAQIKLQMFNSQP